MSIHTQLALDFIAEWGERYQLRFSTSKSNWFIFHRYRSSNLNAAVSLTLYGAQLSPSTEPKLLGVNLDQQLNFCRHIQAVSQRANSRLRLLKAVSGTHWGAGRRPMRSVYLMFVRSVM